MKMKARWEYAIIVLMVGIIIYLAFYHGRNESKVYACHEVTKSDPKDVQDMCKRLVRTYER
jgi:uncharacterized membrane-anchored protein YhcB (DUF1043 family)